MKKVIIALFITVCALATFGAKLGEIQGGKDVDKSWLSHMSGGIVPSYDAVAGVTVFDDQTDKGLFNLQRIYSAGAIIKNSSITVSVDLAFSDVAPSPRVVFCTGFRPCADGRSLLLGWSYNLKGKKTIGLIDADLRPLVELKEFNWDDGKFHNYQVEKYHDTASGKTLIQVKLDGKNLLVTPYDYSELPVTGKTGKAVFSFGSTTPDKVKVALKQLYCEAGEDDKPLIVSAKSKRIASFDGKGLPNDISKSANERWNLTIGNQCKVIPDTTGNGALEIADEGNIVGTVVNINKLINLNDPAKDETEFGITVAFDYSMRSQAPSFHCGFRGESNTAGKTVALAWYNTLEGKYYIGLMDLNSDMLFPVADFKWDDGVFRKYEVKKYKDAKTGQMLVQVLIDGKSQFKEPVPYAKLFDSQRGAGFQIGTSSFAMVKARIKDFYCGYLTKIPSPAAKNSYQVPDKNITIMLKEWQNIGEQLVSERIKLVPNRDYQVSGEIKLSGLPSALKIGYSQFTGKYPEPVMPITSLTLSAFENGSARFVVPIYQRKEYDSGQVTLSLEGKGKIEDIKIQVSGSTEYKKDFTAPVKNNFVIPSQELQKMLGVETATYIKLDKNNIFFDASKRDIAPFMYVGSMKTLKYLCNWGGFEKQGVLLQSVHHSGSDDFPAFWVGKEKYNFEGVKAILEYLLSKSPQSKIILGVWVNPYQNWGLENPSEVCANIKGEYANGNDHFGEWSKVVQPNSKLLPSIFSQKAIDDIAKMLVTLDEFLAKEPVGKRVVGYYLWGFNDADFGHWVHPATSKITELDDYSPAAKQAWENWLRERYDNSIEKLNISWGKKYATFDEIVLPTPDERRAKSAETTPWLLGKQFQYLADFNRFYGETPSRFIAKIMDKFRAERGTEKYFMVHNGNVMHGWRGYTGFGLLSKADGLNGISATSDYGLRQRSYPGGCDSLPESLRLNNKIFFHEFDYRTHLMPSQGETWDFGVGRSSDNENFRGMLHREGLNMLARGQGIYCMDMSGQWYFNELIMKNIGDLYKLFADKTLRQGNLEADVAYFIGEDSANFLSDDLDASYFLMRNTRRQRPEWDTANVPYHLYLQRDIADRNLPDYKVYVFAMPQFIAASELEAIEKLKVAGKTIIFLHAPGVAVNPDMMEQQIQKITGMNVKRLPGKTALAGQWLNKTEEPLLKKLTGNFGDRPLFFAFCDRESRGLGFEITDSSAIPLAVYRDNPSAIAAAFKKSGKSEIYYFAVPWLEAQFIHNLAQKHGAWRAGKQVGDTVYGNQFLVGVHSAVAGTKVLCPKYPSRVTDAITGQLIATNTSEFSVDVPIGQTKIFRTERLK